MLNLFRSLIPRLGWFSNYIFFYIISRSKQLYESHENTEYIWFGFGGTLETSRGGKCRLPTLIIIKLFLYLRMPWKSNFPRRTNSGYIYPQYTCWTGSDHASFSVGGGEAWSKSLLTGLPWSIVYRTKLDLKFYKFNQKTFQ